MALLTTFESLSTHCNIIRLFETKKSKIETSKCRDYMGILQGNPPLQM